MQPGDTGLSSSLDSLNRPTHKQVEQHHRMKAKEYFEELRELLPWSRDKCDRNRTLQEAIEYVKELQGVSTPRNRDECDDGLQFEMDGVRAKKEPEEARQLSHNQMEQRRRQLAKAHFEELRALLPDSGKYDKNTILFHTIAMIRKLTGQEKTPTSSPSPQNLGDGLSRSVPTSWASARHTVAADSSMCGLAGLTRAASSLSSASDLADLLSTSCPEGSRKRSPSAMLADGSCERKRRVSDVLDEDAPHIRDLGKSEAQAAEDAAHEEMMAFKALTLLSECAERLSLESARNTPASTPKIAPQAVAAGTGGVLEAMSLTALCS